MNYKVVLLTFLVISHTDIHTLFLLTSKEDAEKYGHKHMHPNIPGELHNMTLEEIPKPKQCELLSGR